MTENAFTNELARVLARPDFEELRRKLSIHQKVSSDQDLDLKPEWTDECSAVFGAGLEDPDAGFAYVILAAATYDDPAYLALLAAGPLEDILIEPSPEMLDRIVEESRRTARFRWMLSGVWLHAIRPDCAKILTDAIGDISMDRGDPLPPRPWA